MNKGIKNLKSRTELVSSLFYIIILLYICIAGLGCNGTENEEHKFKIGFSQVQSDDDWRKTMNSEMKREVSFHDNIEFIKKDAGENANKQIAQIEELVKAKVDLLIVCPIASIPLTPILEKVYQSGIPVVLIDRRINSENYTSFIGGSNYEIGKIAAKYAINLLKKKGNVLVIKGISNASPFIDREKGFIDFIAQEKEIKIIKELEDHQVDYEKELINVLSKHKDIDIVFAHTDFIAKHIYEINKKIGGNPKLKIIGVDGLPNPGLGMDMVDKKQLTATVTYPTGGQEAILTALDILNKKPFAKINLLKETVIDSSNVNTLFQQSTKINSQQIDIDKRQEKINQQIKITKNQTNIILAISITLALMIILGGVLLFYLNENKKIRIKIENQNNEIIKQKNNLEILIEKLKEASDAKFNFFTNISHELRTPLTLIMAPLEDTLKSSKLHFTLKGNLELIERNANRLLRLINQLMDFRKIEEGKMNLKISTFDLQHFISEIAFNFNNLAKKKNIVYNTKFKAEPFNISTDLEMLDKVLFNILSNAFKFTEEYGNISIIVENNIKDNTATIRVIDNGIGMTEEEAQHAFDIFYQGHSSTLQGTGIGLSLSKELIHLLNGTIQINSKKGLGTEFIITLPIIKEVPIPLDEQNSNTANTLDKSISGLYINDFIPIEIENNNSISNAEYTIILIEDNVDLREFLKNKLNVNYEIITAENGEDGLNLIYEYIPDLVITDIIMPKLNGFALTEIIKNDVKTSHIPVIQLTAKNANEDQIEGMKTKADAYITKPFNFEYLEETINAILKNRFTLKNHFTSELTSESKSNMPNKLDRKFINDFTSIVEKNLSNENVSVDDICREIGVSRVQLYRKVRALLGYNINEYILSVRLQRAKYLLLNENITISEVAYKVGFSSQAYFSTVFKSKFNITPKEFKEKKVI